MGKKENIFLTLGLVAFVIAVGSMVYFWLKPNETNLNRYEIVIDSLNQENKKLDSLFDLEKDKKDQVRILYKRVSIKGELDSLKNLREDLEKLKLEEPPLSDSISADSLRSILIKQFNQ